jgi:hypothetical protein
MAEKQRMTKSQSQKLKMKMALGKESGKERSKAKLILKEVRESLLSRESSIADGLLAIASAMAASAAPPSAPVSAIEGTLSSIANSLQEQSACLRFLMENLRK